MNTHMLVFLLFLTQGGECPPRPSNDRCTNATAIGSFPFSTSVNIFGARNVPFESSASSCYNVDPSTRGVWYQLDGDGSCVKVALQSNFAAGIAVYKGFCEELTCAFQSPYLKVGASNFTLSTEAGQTYYILVGGFDDDIGVFSLDVSVSIRQGSSKGSTDSIWYPFLPIEYLVSICFYREGLARQMISVTTPPRLQKSLFIREEPMRIRRLKPWIAECPCAIILTRRSCLFGMRCKATARV
jgi:hypothetical protein